MHCLWHLSLEWNYNRIRIGGGAACEEGLPAILPVRRGMRNYQRQAQRARFGRPVRSVPAPRGVGVLPPSLPAAELMTGPFSSGVERTQGRQQTNWGRCLTLGPVARALCVSGRSWVTSWRRRSSGCRAIQSSAQRVRSRRSRLGCRRSGGSRPVGACGDLCCPPGLLLLESWLWGCRVGELRGREA